MKYQVGDKVRITSSCRVNGLHAGDVVTIDWSGLDLNNIPMYTVSEDSGGNLLDECEIEPYNVGWVCPRCGAVNAPWVRTCYCRRVDVDLGTALFVTTIGNIYVVVLAGYVGSVEHSRGILYETL